MGRPLKDSSSKPSNEKLMEAAFQLVRSKGYAAATVDDFCKAAGVTKGTFFHYFVSKEDLAIHAAKHWSDVTEAFFEQSSYRLKADPLDRVIGYLELRRDIIQGEISAFTCLVGTMAQEVHSSHPLIREACLASMLSHIVPLEKDIVEALRVYQPPHPPEAHSLALHTQAVLQGAFILAKATTDLQIAVSSVNHLITYVKLIFKQKKDLP